MVATVQGNEKDVSNWVVKKKKSWKSEFSILFMWKSNSLCQKVGTSNINNSQY